MSTNQIYPELLSVNSLNPFHSAISSSRNQMFSGHIGSKLVIAEPTERSIQTGTEREFGKYTFKVEMPVDGTILAIFDKYKKTLGNDSIKENSETYVIYEDIYTKELGVILLPKYCSNHQYFGFRYISKEGLNKIIIGNTIKKGTVFLDSPNITPDGGYTYGIEVNVAYMTHPASSEDSVLVSESYLRKIRFKTYETRVVSWGSNSYPLNLYGDINDYKIFPDIGENIRDDGLLMATRDYAPTELGAIEKGIDDSMYVDKDFDTTVYANGSSGKVIDIKIHHDIINKNYSDISRDTQAEKYDQARRVFSKQIVDFWHKMKKQKGGTLQLTPAFNRLIVECISVTEEGKSPTIKKHYRNIPIDHYRLEFIIEYDNEPNIGFKITDTAGGKGIICQVVPDDYMPVDSEGNRAEIVMDPNSTVSRMNVGRLYEQYINSASRDTHKRLCSMLNVIPKSSKNKSSKVINKENIDNAFNYLLGYYKIVSPIMYGWFIDNKVKQSKIDYLYDIIELGICLLMPTNNSPELQTMINELELSYRPLYGPVTYRGNSGNLVTTIDNIRIGLVYTLCLEKTGDDWSATSSGKLQHHGVLSPLTKVDKYSKPTRNQAVRGTGESECRILGSYLDPEYLPELMDRNNSPSTHRLIVDNLLNSDIPTNINNLVDRKVHPLGSSKPLQLIHHILQCSGIEFTNVNEE